MGDDALIYKAGAWSLSMADANKIFDKNRLLISCIEKLKYDIENNDPSDKKAQAMINDVLYHYCWKLIDNESI